MKTWLLDTGPIVAYLDRRDPWHEAVVPRFESFTGRLATTSAVVTEAMQFVSASPDGPGLLAELISASRTEVFDLCQLPELQSAVELMAKYGGTPMDFADATLVLLSEAIKVREIFTLDRRGFATYRTRRRRAFSLVLDME